MQRKRPQFSSLSEATSIREIFSENKIKYSGALTLAQEILRETSFLSSSDRELIAAYVSKLNNCDYCCGSHTVFAKSVGTTDEDLQCVIADQSCDGHRLEPILLYVKKLTLSPSSVSQEDLDLVLSSGFTEDELKDAISVCAIFNFFNRIVEGHGLDKNEHTWDMASEMIKTHGYDRRY
jgi:uncharacterized peroxidase-related enzyme